MELNLKRRGIQEEALEKLRKANFYGMIQLATGAGKTLIMLKSLEEIEKFYPVKSILYTCNSINLRDKDFVDEVNKWGYERFLPVMERMCYQSAYKLENESYDVLLGDENDFMLSDEYIKLLQNNKFKFVILVSATLEPKKLRLLKSITPKIPIVYKKELSDLENEEVLNKSKYYYVNYLLNDYENAKYLEYNRVISNIIKEYGEDHAKLNEKLKFVSQQRKLFLNKLESSELVAKKLLREIKGRTLVFSELTEQVDSVTPYTYHGKNAKDDNLKEFNEGRIDTLGVCGKIDRGVNLNGVQNIVVEGCSSSKTKIVQKLGRGKRLKVDEFLNVYLLVPYYKAKFPKGTIKPTIVDKWLKSALGDFNIKSEVYQFKK